MSKGTWCTPQYLIKCLKKLQKTMPDATYEEIQEAIIDLKCGHFFYGEKIPQYRVAQKIQEEIESDRRWKEIRARKAKEEEDRKKAEKARQIEIEIAYANWLTEQSNLPSGQRTEMPDIVKKAI
jgi:hypothetical protein